MRIGSSRGRRRLSELLQLKGGVEMCFRAILLKTRIGLVSIDQIIFAHPSQHYGAFHSPIDFDLYLCHLPLELLLLQL